MNEETPPRERATEPRNTFLPHYAPEWVVQWMQENNLVAISRGAYDFIRGAEAAPRGYIRIRTPDDPNGWTAEGDLVAGMPYVYSSGDVAVDIEWFEGAAPHVHQWTAGTQPGPYPGLPAATCIAPGHSEGAAPRAEGHVHEWVREYAPNYRQVSEANDWREECACGAFRSGTDDPPAAPRAEGLDYARGWNDAVAAVAPPLNDELLRQAIRNVREQDPAEYLDRGDETDAIAAEYARLSRPPDERVPEEGR